MTKEIIPKRLCNIYGDKFGTGYAGNVWSTLCISPTLQTMQGGNRQPLVLIRNDNDRNNKDM